MFSWSVAPHVWATERAKDKTLGPKSFVCSKNANSGKPFATRDEAMIYAIECGWKPYQIEVTQ